MPVVAVLGKPNISENHESPFTSETSKSVMVILSTGIFKPSLINSSSTQCDYLNPTARQPFATLN